MPYFVFADIMVKDMKVLGGRAPLSVVLNNGHLKKAAFEAMPSDWE